MINKGSIIDGCYVKHCDFSKAVLWKTRELSIPVDVLTMVYKEAHRKKLIFIGTGADKSNKVFDLDEIKAFGNLKVVGQEEQWYFPIKLDQKAKKK